MTRMTTRSKDPGVWLQVTSASTVNGKHDTKKATERLVAQSFIESRYGDAGVSTLDSVPPDASGNEVPPDVLIVEIGGSRLGLELVRATQPTPTSPWHAVENFPVESEWVERIGSLIHSKNSDIPRWTESCDRRGVLVYSDAVGLASCALEVAASLDIGDTEFDEMWLLLSYLVDHNTGEMTQCALIDLRAGELVQ